MRYFGALPEGAPLFCARKGYLVRKVAGNVEVCVRMGCLVRKVDSRRQKVEGRRQEAGGRRQKAEVRRQEAGGRRGGWSVDKLWGK